MVYDKIVIVDPAGKELAVQEVPHVAGTHHPLQIAEVLRERFYWVPTSGQLSAFVKRPPIEAIGIKYDPEGIELGRVEALGRFVT